MWLGFKRLSYFEQHESSDGFSSTNVAGCDLNTKSIYIIIIIIITIIMFSRSSSRSRSTERNETFIYLFQFIYLHIHSLCFSDRS